MLLIEAFIRRKIHNNHKQAFVLLAVKYRFLTTICEMTTTRRSAPSVRLKRPDADAPPEDTAFMQIYRQLRGVPSDRLRQSDQAWTVHFLKEGAQDAGGPYRESLVILCEELRSGRLPLFVPCPNKIDGNGENREKLVPNPLCKTPEDLDKFFFFGKVFSWVFAFVVFFPLTNGIVHFSCWALQSDRIRILASIFRRWSGSA